MQEGYPESWPWPLRFVFQLIAYKLSSFLSHAMTPLAMSFQVFEMAPSLFMIEVRKAMGDTLDYHKVRSTLFITCIRVDNSQSVFFNHYSVK